jgi:hypothetical protein
MFCPLVLHPPDLICVRPTLPVRPFGVTQTGVMSVGRTGYFGKADRQTFMDRISLCPKGGHQGGNPRVSESAGKNKFSLPVNFLHKCPEILTADSCE